MNNPCLKCKMSAAEKAACCGCPERLEYEKHKAESYKGKHDTKITVTLELDNPYDLDAEEIKKDIRMAEDQIGWHYDYKIVSIDVN